MATLVSTPSQTDTRRRARLNFRALPPIVLALLLLDTAYLYIANRASGPPRIALAAFSYEGTLLLHLGLGLLTLFYVAARAGALVRALRERKGALSVVGALASLCLTVCLLTGTAMIGIGLQWLSLRTRPTLLILHDTSTLGFLIFGLAWLVLRARTALANAPEKRQLLTARRMGLVCGVPFVGLLAYTLYTPNTDRVIKNPALPVFIADDEGDGKSGKFFPASVQSVGGQFFPSKYFIDSKTCGKVGCHPDIYAQWNGSAHHLASFNNQWYRKAIEYMQEVAGVEPSKWCGGCHDMAVLLTEDPKKPGHSRFDTPIALHNYPAEQFPESHAGIGCAVCHSIVHVKSTMGNSDYLADYPPMHKYMDTDNPTLESVQGFLTRLAPEPHKKTFLRPFHVENTAKFCSSCHKVHLDVPVNGYRYFRGFNDYDTWQQSGVSGFGAASFYYPMDDKTGQPAFKKCADCHMPKVPSNDAGNVDGIVHNHMFPGGNTALPTVYHDAKQLAATQKFLTDKTVSVDIFALRRQEEGAKSQGSKGTQKPVARNPGLPATPRAASLNGDPNGLDITPAANTSTVKETLVAPLNRGGMGAVLRRGESPLVDVVVRTLKMGHGFPGGTIDALEVWVELEAKDDKGRTIYHSGALQWPDGPVEEGAERYRSLLVDGHSNPINKRNAWSARAVVYAKIIPPGAADTVHFRLNIPKDCGSSITLTAKVNYRKFTWWNNQFAYAGRAEGTSKGKSALTSIADRDDMGPDGPVQVALGYANGTQQTRGLVSHGWDDRPMHFDKDTANVSGPVKEVPNLPITVLATNTITLPVVAANGSLNAPATPAPTDEDSKKKERVRWNDYGIGLLLQGDFRNATNAFTQVTKMAPKWPEGWVNIGRVRQAEQDTGAAEAAFHAAIALYDANPTPMTPYQKARTQNFYAQTLFSQGRVEEALAMLAEVLKVFPDDRNVRNLTGTILFRLGRYDEAITHLTYTLTIDPEDVAAHYNLMKCYRGKRDAVNADIHERLYKRFKADETTTDLIGPYLRSHPSDNNLVQRIHEHGDAISHPKPAWLIQREADAARRKGSKVALK